MPQPAACRQRRSDCRNWPARYRGTWSDARADFYHRAFGQHARAGLDPDIHQIGVGPTHDGEMAARNAIVLGAPYQREVRDLVEDAKAGLQSAALASGGDYLLNWALEHRERINGRIRRELSTSQIAIFEAVGQILVKTEVR